MTCNAYTSYSSDSTAYSIFGAVIPKGETHKVRIIYNVGTKTSVEVYLDGERINNFTVNAVNDTESNYYGFGFYFRSPTYNSDLDLSFDNVFLGIIEAK